jgi:hypothetical protein
MSSCCGNGECLKQKNLTEYRKTKCSHNCNLVECYNFKLCKQMRPRWVLNCDNGMCKDCAIMLGKLKFLDIKDECSICIEHKDMIEISCGKHKVCLECWKNWSETSTQIPLTCPLCRNPIWK